MKFWMIALLAFAGLVIFRMVTPDTEADKYNPPQYVPPCMYDPETNQPFPTPCKE